MIVIGSSYSIVVYYHTSLSKRSYDRTQQVVNSELKLSPSLTQNSIRSLANLNIVTY